MTTSGELGSPLPPIRAVVVEANCQSMCLCRQDRSRSPRQVQPTSTWEFLMRSDSMEPPGFYGDNVGSLELDATIQAGGGQSSSGPVIGFGDSIAAGYGLSQAAEWNPDFLSSRFPN